MKTYYGITEEEQAQIFLESKPLLENQLRLGSTAYVKTLSERGYLSFEALSRSEEVENNDYPTAILAYWKLAIIRQDIPFFNDLCQFYPKFYTKWYADNGGPIDLSVTSKDPRAGRILRAFPDIIRTPHFWMRLRESGLDARYSVENDLGGQDLNILYGNVLHGIRLFTNTKNGWKQRDKKDNWYPGERPIDINWPLRELFANKSQNVWLYNSFSVHRLQEALACLVKDLAQGCRAKVYGCQTDPYDDVEYPPRLSPNTISL